MSKAHENDTVFNGALYLVLQSNNTDEFPSFDAFRPLHPLYTNIVLQIKALVLLQNDTTYQKLLLQFHKEQQDKLALQLISKELQYVSQLSIGNVSSDSTVATYQRYYHIPITNLLDEKTLWLISVSPNEKREKMQINLEHLRLLPQQTSNYFFQWVPTK